MITPGSPEPVILVSSLLLAIPKLCEVGPGTILGTNEAYRYGIIFPVKDRHLRVLSSSSRLEFCIQFLETLQPIRRKGTRKHVM